jgi:prepilin-type N-terminal cleavage/methylation domain-containing protein
MRLPGGALERGGRGFTLLEAMLALLLSALVAGWAVPALRDVWLSARLRVSTQHLLTVLETARYQSLVAPRELTICASLDGLRCDRDHGRRLLVFIDTNEDGVLDAGEQLQSDEVLLQEDEAWLVWRAFQNKPFLRWGRGRTDSMNGTFTLCNGQRREEWLRQLVVNRVGRTRLVSPLRAGGSTLAAARKVCGW